MKKETAEVLSIDGREIRVTNPDKPYFSRQIKLSKLDLVRYYLSVAPGALAGIADRPLVLKRFVDGAEKPAAGANPPVDPDRGGSLTEQYIFARVLAAIINEAALAHASEAAGGKDIRWLF